MNPPPLPRIALLLLLIFAHLGPVPAIAEQDYDADDVKAALLLKIIRFISWPDTKLNTADATVSLCIDAGARKFRAFRTIHGKALSGPTLTVSRFDPQQPKSQNCDVILFGGDTTDLRSQEVVNRQAALTVGESIRFTRQGGMLALLVQDGRMRIFANPQAAKRQGISINSQLLELSTIIETHSSRSGT